MKTLDRFLESIRAGVALAGLLAGACGGSPGTTADASVATDTQGPDQLPPLASTTFVCSGQDFGNGPGYYGQCCEHLICRPLVDGACPIGNDGKFYGSGTCLCGGDHPIQGPFAVDPADPVTAEARAAGPCCYVTSSILCDGRPLHVDETVRVAAVVGRSDWC
jgi:hypothetical protein